MSEQTMDQMAEVKAMGEVTKALAGLDKAAIGRVLSWAAGSFDAPMIGQKYKQSFTKAEADGESSGEVREFDSIADLYSAAQPKVDSDRALVAGYWFQFKEGQEDFASQTINTALKNLGHGVTNITKALETLKAQSPTLVMQVRKSGSTQQARKKYKLTAAGKKAVELLIGQNSTN